MEKGAVGCIKGAGGYASDESSSAAFLTVFSFAGAVNISATPFIGVALEDIQWSVRV